MKITGFPSLKDIRFTSEGSRSPQGGGRAPAFSAGELLRGKVLGFTPEGKVLLAIGETTVEARSEVALKVGGEFWFEVRQGGAESWLGLAEQKGAAQEVVRMLGLGTPALARLLPALAQLLEQSASLPAGLRAQLEEIVQLLSATAQGGEPAPEKVLQLLSSLQGIQARTEMALPEQLSRLLAELPAEKGEAPSALGRSHALLAAMAHCNEQVPAQHQPLFWLFPCFFAMGEGAGSWLMQSTTEEDAADGAAYTLSFFLEMSRLGEVQLQLTVQGETVRGTFSLTDKAALEYMRQELPELRERLAGLGYQVGNLSCQMATHRLLQGLKQALEEAAGLAPSRLLDVKA